ncbi:MAG TPA: hypothetical protein VN650_11000 [Gemmatimonadaceae bacterium]|nr:hypothetical protein [Gemmatimonadaceae bacterium]
MADRLVRDELLDSDRYWALPSDTHRMLFVHFLLSADDLGNAQATTGTFRRRLLQRDKPVTEQECAQLIADLCTADIVRKFEYDGKRFIHIPRFRQRLRSYKRVHPRPPPEIEDKEINKLLSNLSDICPTLDTHTTDTSQSRAVEVKGSEGKNFKNRAHAPDPVDKSAQPLRKRDHPAAKESPGKSTPTATQTPNGHSTAAPRTPRDWRSNSNAAAIYGQSLGAPPMPGESLPAYVGRLDRLLAMLGPGQRPRRHGADP